MRGYLTMKNILTDKEKEIFLRHIPIAEHRKVMQLHINGESKEAIARKIEYSVRQIERIITLYWRNVCSMLLQENALKEGEDNE